MTQDDKGEGRGMEWSEKRWRNLWTAPKACKVILLNQTQYISIYHNCIINDTKLWDWDQTEMKWEQMLCNIKISTILYKYKLYTAVTIQPHTQGAQKNKHGKEKYQYSLVLDWSLV